MSNLSWRERISRRSLLGFLITMPVAASVSRSIAPKRYGYLDVSLHCGHFNATGETLHVYLNGKDVTRQCREANDIVGYVILFCGVDGMVRHLTQSHDKKSGLIEASRMGDGQRYYDRVCQHTLHGHVEIRPGEKFNV